jgi:hypothetical protein
MINNIFVWKPFHFRLQQCIRQWTKPATLSLISGVLSDLTRSRANLIKENALLRHNWLSSTGRWNDLCLPVVTDSAWYCSLAAPGSGNKPFTLLDQIHSYDGIGNCTVSISIWNQRTRKTSQRFQLKRSRSSVRWPRKIAYGERSGSGVDCSSWGSRCVKDHSEILAKRNGIDDFKSNLGYLCEESCQRYLGLATLPRLMICYFGLGITLWSWGSKYAGSCISPWPVAQRMNGPHSNCANQHLGVKVRSFSS